jgi:iron complex transport system substrate-binding protein
MNPLLLNKYKKLNWLCAICSAAILLAGCSKTSDPDTTTRQMMDQLGRTVQLPQQIERVAAMHHFGGKIAFALGLQDKLVEQSIYGLEAKALAVADPVFKAKPEITQGANLNVEALVGLNPQVVFVYASFDKSELDRLENAGMRVFAVKGETIEESFTAVRLMGEVMNCSDRADHYIEQCRHILTLVDQRVGDIPRDQRPTVMFAGPKSIFTAATGEMLQTEILERAGGLNVAKELKGFWAEVSPEQVAAWNPKVIFLGSYLGTYGIDDIYQDDQFAMLSAVKNKRVYGFPSTIGWWDYPAPHCVLGVIWAAKALYPDRFADVDLTALADDFYREFTGYRFSDLGGVLP